jgi:aryl-alcohol dehydrogenase-like predicted oxidoreductase
LQPLYNLYDRAGFEEKLAPLCWDEGLGVITYYSLASGFLTGKYRSKADLDKSVRGAKAVAYLDDRGLRILDALGKVAKQLHAEPASVALAWLMARPGITAPIASATSVKQLQALTAAAKLRLDKQAIELLDKASAVQASARTAA